MNDLLGDILEHFAKYNDRWHSSRLSTSGISSTSCAVTDLQVNLQALVVDFCLKSNEMKLLSDNQGRLQQSKQTESAKVSTAKEKNGSIEGNSSYVAVGPAAVATPLFSQRLQEKQDVSASGGTGSLEDSSDGATSPSLTKCLNSADRLPLLDSSMFMTLVLVPRMLNFRDLWEEQAEAKVGDQMFWPTNKLLPFNTVRKFSPSDCRNISRFPEGSMRRSQITLVMKIK